MHDGKQVEQHGSVVELGEEDGVIGLRLGGLDPLQVGVDGAGVVAALCAGCGSRCSSFASWIRTEVVGDGGSRHRRGAWNLDVACWKELE